MRVPIRWKFLVLLLVISLLPLMAVRLRCSTRMFEIRDEIVEDSQNRLTQTSIGHLLDLARTQQHAMETSIQMAELAMFHQVGVVTSQLQQSPADAHAPTAHTKPPTRLRTRSLEPVTPLNPDHAELSAFGDAAATSRLSALLPVYQSLHARLPESVLWQQTMLSNGAFSIYPGIGEVLPRTSARQAPSWYRKAVQSSGPVWTIPDKDPTAHKAIFTVSHALRDADNATLGVTAISLSMNSMQNSDGLASISGNSQALLVRLPSETEGGYPRIVASADMDSSRKLCWRSDMEELPLRPTESMTNWNLPTTMRMDQIEFGEVHRHGRDWVWAGARFQRIAQIAYVLLVPKEDIMRSAEEQSALVNSRLQQLFQTMTSTYMLIALGVAAISMVISKYIARDIRAIHNALSRAAGGDFDSRCHVRRNDELGELAAMMDLAIPALHERVSLKNALHVAHDVQQSLLPQSAPRIMGYDIAGRSQYCEGIGGDFLDFIPAGENELYVLIGDVSGHGIPAALFMATARAQLRATLRHTPSLSASIAWVNELLVEDTGKSGNFLTLFVTRIHADEPAMHWACAGHEPVLIFDLSTSSWSQLGPEDIPLGVEPGWLYHTHSSAIPERGVMLLGTDGLWEAANAHGEFFGKDRVKHIVEAHAWESAAAIMDAVLHAVQVHMGAEKPADDMTVVVIKVACGGDQC